MIVVEINCSTVRQRATDKIKEVSDIAEEMGYSFELEPRENSRGYNDYHIRVSIPEDKRKIPFNHARKMHDITSKLDKLYLEYSVHSEPNKKQYITPRYCIECSEKVKDRIDENIQLTGTVNIIGQKK